MISLDTFSKLLYHRDIDIMGPGEVGYWDEVRKEYRDEANYYLTEHEPEDWPCHILQSIGQHDLYHPNCDGE